MSRFTGMELTFHTKNNKLQQSSTGFEIWFGTKGAEIQILFPPYQFLPPLLDNQRDGHTYRLYACIGAGSSHCNRKGSGWRSQRWWWRSRTSAAAADAKQHSERASRKDPAWNLPPGSFPLSKQNYYQQADCQRPRTDAEVDRGRPQRRPRRQLGPGRQFLFLAADLIS